MLHRVMHYYPQMDTTTLDPSQYYARTVPSGHTELICTQTGRLVALIEDPNVPPNLAKTTLPNGEDIWVDTNLPASCLANAGHGLIPYHPWIVDALCEKVASGMSLTRACKEPGMPTYAVLMRWRRKYPEVSELLERAREDRAEHHRDRAVEIAESSSEDSLGTSTLKHNAHKWAAGVDNARFSPKAKIEATITTPTQIIVNTGIDRNPLPANPVSTPTILLEDAHGLQADAAGNSGRGDDGGDGSASGGDINAG